MFFFYTTYVTHTVGQIKPGSTGPDKIIDLGSLGISASCGAMMFVPDGFAGAGRLKIGIYSTSGWYDMTVTPDGSGTFDIVDPAYITNTGGGPEGAVYIADYNPKFDVDSLLISRYASGDVIAYEIDTNGDPLIATQRTFISGLVGAMGAAIDPETGQFLFSTFGGTNHVVLVKGFTTPCPADVNFDNVVNIDDIFTVLGLWGPCPE